MYFKLHQMHLQSNYATKLFCCLLLFAALFGGDAGDTKCAAFYVKNSIISKITPNCRQMYGDGRQLEIPPYKIGETIHIRHGRYEGCRGTILDCEFDLSSEKWKVLLVRDCRTNTSNYMHYLHKVGHGRSAWYTVDSITPLTSPLTDTAIVKSKRGVVDVHQPIKNIIECRSPLEIYAALNISNNFKIHQNVRTSNICDAVIKIAKLFSKLTAVDGNTRELNATHLLNDSRFVGIIETLEERVVKGEIKRFIDYAWIPWSFAKLNLSQNKKYKKLVESMIETMANDVQLNSTLNELHPVGVSALLWGYAKCNYTNTTFWRYAKDRILQVTDKFNAHELSNIIYSFAKVNAFDEQLFDVMACEVINKIDGFSIQGLSNVLWAFGRSNYLHKKLFEFTDRQLIKRKSALNEMSATLILWTYGRLGYYKREVFDVIEEVVVRSIHQLQPPQITQILWALSNTPCTMHTGGRALLNKLVDVLPSFSVKQIALTMYSISKMHRLDEYLLELYIEELEKRDSECFRAVDVSMICAACAYVDTLEAPSIEKLIKVATQLCLRDEISPHELTWLMAGASHLEVKDKQFLRIALTNAHNNFDKFSLEYIASFVESLMHLFGKQIEVTEQQMITKYLMLTAEKLKTEILQNSFHSNAASIGSIVSLLLSLVQQNTLELNYLFLMQNLLKKLKANEMQLKSTDLQMLNSLLSILKLEDDEEWKSLVSSILRNTKSSISSSSNQNQKFNSKYISIPSNVDAEDFIDTTLNG